MKGMKIVFALVVISVMAMGLGSANAAIFETDFESYSGGTPVGQDGWAGWGSPNAYIDNSTLEHQYMRGYQWLGTSGIGRNTSALYRPFAAQTGQVKLEVLYSPNQSESSWRSVSLRDSSATGPEWYYSSDDIAALVGTSRKYDDPGDGGKWFFALDADGRQWLTDGPEALKANVYKIVIDANVGTQTYDATVNLYDIDTGVVGAEVASWTGLSFNNTVSDISRVFVQSWDNTSHWDNFNITPEPATLAVLALGGFAVLLRRKR